MKYDFDQEVKDYRDQLLDGTLTQKDIEGMIKEALYYDNFQLVAILAQAMANCLEGL